MRNEKIALNMSGISTIKWKSPKDILFTEKVKHGIKTLP